MIVIITTLLMGCTALNHRAHYSTPDFSALTLHPNGSYSEEHVNFKLVTSIYGTGDFSQTLFYGETSIAGVYKNLGGWPDTDPQPIFEYTLKETQSFGGDNSLKLKGTIVFLPEERGPRIQVLANEWDMHEWNVAIEMHLNANGYYTLTNDFH